MTLGCARNEVDSEELAARLDQGGFALVENADDAEAVPVVVRAADGSIAFRGSVGPDEPRTVRVPGGEAIVRTPDAAAVQAKVDGRDVAVLDAPGPEVQSSLRP